MKKQNDRLCILFATGLHLVCKRQNFAVSRFTPSHFFQELRIFADEMGNESSYIEKNVRGELAFCGLSLSILMYETK